MPQDMKSGFNLPVDPDEKTVADRYFSRIKRARSATTLSGNLCIFMGWIFAIVGLFSTIYLVFNGASDLAIIGGFTVTLFLALVGAPMAALGSQTNDARRVAEITYTQAKYIEFFGKQLK